MANQKLTALTADTSLDDADLLYTVVDVATTPVSRKITWTTVKAFLKTYFDGIYGTGIPRGGLWGLTLSNNGTDPTNDIDIAVGECRSSDDGADMTLASAITKRLDAAWSVGTGNGGLDTGAVGNNTYHIWLIKRSDTGVVDVLFSLSATAPTMPASYDYKRRIGSIMRESGVIVPFVQDGDTFMRKVPINSVLATNPGTSAVTRTLHVPTGIRVLAILTIVTSATTTAECPGGVFISDLSQTDTAAGGATATIYHYITLAATTSIGAIGKVFTNTSAQVRSRLEVSSTNTILNIATNGWVDTRNRLA